MVNGSLLNIGLRYKDNSTVIFDQCTAKVALSFGRAKHSKNLERYLIHSKYTKWWCTCVPYYIMKLKNFKTTSMQFGMAAAILGQQ